MWKLDSMSVKIQQMPGISFFLEHGNLLQTCSSKMGTAVLKEKKIYCNSQWLLRFQQVLMLLSIQEVPVKMVQVCPVSHYHLQICSTWCADCYVSFVCYHSSRASSVPPEPFHSCRTILSRCPWQTWISLRSEKCTVWSHDDYHDNND